MFHQFSSSSALALAAVLLLVPGAAFASGEFCGSLPPEPSQASISYFDDTLDDGAQVWVAIAEYELSTGSWAKAHLAVNSEGRGEMYFAIDGHIAMYVTYANDGSARAPIVTSWAPDESRYPPELIAELMQEAIGEKMIHGMFPQEFPCSSFGKGAVKAAKYLWIAANGALAATCCLAATPTCVVCAAGAAASMTAGAESADGYCD